jgi:hypothetical protein
LASLKGKYIIGLSVYKSLSGIPQTEVRKRSLELRINVRRGFIGSSSKVGLVSGSLDTKAYRYPLKGSEKRSLELPINVHGEFIRYPLLAGLVLSYLYTKAYRVSLKGR